LVDGLRDLRSILADTYFYEFHVLAAIAKAMEKGFLKKTIHPELKGLATQTFSRQDAEDHLPHFRNAVKFGVDELAARERLAVVYEKLGKVDDAVIQYNFIGDALYRMQKAAKAIKAYQMAVQLKPGEILITEKITRIYREAASQELGKGNVEHAVQLLEGALRIRPDDREMFVQTMQLLIQEKRLDQLADLCHNITARAKETRTPEVAIHAWRDVSRELPRNTLFRKKLINLYLDFNLPAEAGSEMEILAKQYIERGQDDKARELLDKMRRMGTAGNETKILRRQMAGKNKRKNPRRGHAVRRFAAVLTLFVLVYQGWGHFAWTDLSNKIAVANSLPRGQDDAKDLAPGPRELHSARLMKACDTYCQSFPLTVYHLEARRLATTLREEFEGVHAQRAERKRAILDEARLLAQEGKVEATLALLQPLLNLQEKDAFLTKAQELRDQINTHSQSAVELYEKGRALEKKEDWRGAYHAYHQLSREFPRSALVDGLKLPILMESVPSGAEIHQTHPLHGQVLGTTPQVISLRPEESISIEVRLPGYDPLAVEIDEGAGQPSAVLLSRQHAWELPLEGAARMRPTLANDMLFVGTNSGTLYGLKMATGLEAWRVSGADRTTSLVAPIVVTAEGLFILWNDGRLQCRMPFPTMSLKGSGPELEPQVLGDWFMESLATSHAYSIESESLVVVGTRSGQLRAYDEKKPTPAWVMTLENPPETISSIERDLLVTTQGGNVLRIGINSHAVSWKHEFGPTPVLDAFYNGKTVTVATSKNEIAFLDAANGSTLDTVRLPAAARIYTNSTERRIFVVNAHGRVSLLASESAEILKTVKLPVQIEQLEPVAGALGIVHQNGRGLLLVDAETLEPIWATTTRHAILSVAADANWVAVTMNNGGLRVYPR
jgi:outer membrane protein assembly factor BamB/tetratricopeptide (TPR) repeat protein